MHDFVSKYVNRLDSKGRVSIPAPYRQVLAREGQEILFCCPALGVDAFDAGGLGLRGSIDAYLDAFDAFSEEREMLSTALLGESEGLKIDKDGRVVLTDTIKTYTGITDAVAFVGQGDKFRIWQPERYEAYRAESLKQLPALRHTAGARKMAAREGGEI